MKYKYIIQELATTVGQGLTAYIEVHDRIFDEGSTLKSFVKNIFGRGTPMSELLRQSERLLPVWGVIRHRIAEFRKESYTSLSPEERYYFDLLSSYADAVAKTVDALVDRQRLLNEGSKGMKNGSMTWGAFQESERAYKAAIDGYKAIGQKLNDAAHVVFD